MTTQLQTLNDAYEDPYHQNVAQEGEIVAQNINVKFTPDEKGNSALQEKIAKLEEDEIQI